MRKLVPGGDPWAYLGALIVCPVIVGAGWGHWLFGVVMFGVMLVPVIRRAVGL